MRRWEGLLRPALTARGIALVTISGETPEKIRAARGRHGLDAIMLADPELEVTRRYGLVNRRSVTPTGVRPTPIPTTLLADASGQVRWMDQSADYQQRSHPERVLTAVEQHLHDESSGA